MKHKFLLHSLACVRISSNKIYIIQDEISSDEIPNNLSLRRSKLTFLFCLLKMKWEMKEFLVFRWLSGSCKQPIKQVRVCKRPFSPGLIYASCSGEHNTAIQYGDGVATYSCLSTITSTRHQQHHVSLEAGKRQTSLVSISETSVWHSSLLLFAAFTFWGWWEVERNGLDGALVEGDVCEVLPETSCLVNVLARRFGSENLYSHSPRIAIKTSSAETPPPLNPPLNP